MSSVYRPKPGVAGRQNRVQFARGLPPRVVSVYRRGDVVCHARCGRPLTLHGVRGLIEADFYCYVCLSHVTLPLVVLDSVPMGPVAVEVCRDKGIS